MKTKEIELWQGEFGEQYRERNQITEEDLQNRMNMWSGILRASGQNTYVTSTTESILEVGCGQGINLIALQKLCKLDQNMNQKIPTFYAVEPNKQTQDICEKNCEAEGFLPKFVYGADCNNLLLPNHTVDLVFTSGVLIHIHPDNLLNAMKEIYRVSKKYIICMEYFSPEPRELNYHNKPALWTNDFGSLWLDNFNLTCIGCFFAWKRLTGLDNLTIWVFEKVN